MICKSGCNFDGPEVCWGGEMGYTYVECPKSGGDQFFRHYKGKWSINPDGQKIVFTRKQAMMDSTGWTTTCTCGSSSFARHYRQSLMLDFFSNN